MSPSTIAVPNRNNTEITDNQRLSRTQTKTLINQSEDSDKGSQIITDRSSARSKKSINNEGMITIVTISGDVEQSINDPENDKNEIDILAHL